MICSHKLNRGLYKRKQSDGGSSFMEFMTQEERARGQIKCLGTQRRINFTCNRGTTGNSAAR